MVELNGSESNHVDDISISSEFSQPHEVHENHQYVQFTFAYLKNRRKHVSMKPSRHKMPRIALLMHGARHYERELLSGIAQYANLHSPWQFFRNVAYLPEEQVAPEVLIQSWNPDAMIVRESSPHYYDEILKTQIPVIYIPTTACSDELTNIVVDDLAVGRMAACHLYENGLRNFAFCGVSELFFWSRLRRAGFCEQIEAYGHEVQIFESATGDEFLSWNKQFKVLKDWLSKLSAHTGLMACTDDFALFVQEACIAVGRSIPDEIALVGVGNDESVCELATTPLSSVELNINRAGYNAARFLAESLRARPSARICKHDNIVIEALRVVARRSTDPTETHDPEVGQAIAFICARINHPIDVSDVVQQVQLSRRALYDRFYAATGKTISAYIRNRRLDHFSRLLLETNLTIAEIAYSMGYDSDANVARLFKKYNGLTPIAYRRKHAGRQRQS